MVSIGIYSNSITVELNIHRIAVTPNLKGCVVMKKQKYLKNKRKRIYVYLSHENKQKLKELSEEEQKSISAFVSELVVDKLSTTIKLDLKFDDEEV